MSNVHATYGIRTDNFSVHTVVIQSINYLEYSVSEFLAPVQQVHNEQSWFWSYKG